MNNKKMKTPDLIVEKLRAGYPGIYLLSSEDVRSQRDIRQAADQLGANLYTWTFGKGIIETGKTTKVITDTELPPAFLDALSSQKVKSPAIIVARIFDLFLDDPLVMSKLLDLLPEMKANNKMLVILTPVLKLPKHLEKEFALVESPLPDKETLGSILDGILEGSQIPADRRPDDQTRKHLIESAMGLTAQEAENALALSLVRPKLQKASKVWDPDVVLQEKCESLKKTGLLTYYPPSGQGMKQIGGLSQLKSWVGKRRHAFTEKAKEFGVPPPKGILLVGPPGSGKSLGAKATSEELGLPLLRCDMGKIFAGLVGESESNARTVIQTAEAVAPCVLWLDEIEKGFAGASNGLDSGVGARVLGTFLTWMQEKDAPVFVYATSNDVSALPPELLRKGRFDEIFSVLYPNPQERKEILEIHIRARGRGHLIDGPDARINLDHFVGITEGYSGSEIEAAIVEALYSAFDANMEEGKTRDLNQMDLQDSIDSTKPLSVVMSQKIKSITEWCKDNTRPANSPSGTEVTTPTLGKRAVQA